MKSNFKFYISFILIIFLSLYLLNCSKQNKTQTLYGNIAIVQYLDSPMNDTTKKGILKFFQDEGLKDNIDYNIRIFNAQGDIITLNSIMDTINNSNFNIVIAISTPVLQAALQRINNIPIVFTTVADPVAAGAGQSFEEHLDNVTGISTLGAYKEMTEIISQYFPKYKKIGTLFSPNEINSQINKNHLLKYTSEHNINLKSTPITSIGEIYNATLLMISDIDAICQVICHITDASFPAIINVSNQSDIPVFSFTSQQVHQGALLAVARDYLQAGIDAGRLALKILKGANPRDIPFSFVSKTNIILNLPIANKFGIEFPVELLKSADLIIE